MATILQSLFQVSDKEGGFRFDSLQHDASAAETGLSASLCSELLNVYAQMRTVMLVATAANQRMFDGDESSILVRASTALSSQGRLSKAVAGLKHEPLSMLDHLNSALAALDEALCSEGLLELDTAGCNLRKPMSHCLQWAHDMSMLMQGLRERWLFMCSEALRLEATALEEAIPRWDGVLQTETLDRKLAKARLLDHAKRPMVKPVIKFLQSVTEQATTCAKKWKLEERIDKGITNFVDKAVETGGQYLVIVAGLNAVINYRTASRSTSMADEILDIIRKRYDECPSSTFRCPEVLRGELLAMSAGTPPAAELSASPEAQQTAGSSTKGEAPPRPAVRKSVAPPPLASSGSARPVVVKREAGAPPGDAETARQAKQAKGRGKGARGRQPTPRTT